MIAIKTLAASYSLDATEEYINPAKKIVPFLGIREKTSNQIIYTIRKLNNFYVAYQTKAGGGQQQVANQTGWSVFWNELDQLFKTYAATHPAPESSGDPNKLSASEMLAVENMLKEYGWKMENVETPGHVPHLSIFTNWNSRVYALRKFEGMYYVINALNNDVNKWEIINQFAYFHQALGLLKEFIEAMVNEDPNKLTQQQINAVAKVGADHHFAIGEKSMEMEPDKHKVTWIELVDQQGESPYLVGKDNHHYMIWRTFGPTWDKYLDTNNWGEVLTALDEYLKQWDDNIDNHPNQQAPVATSTSTSKNEGITPEEYGKIRDVVDSYGKMFQAHYIKGNPAQTPYVNVIQQEAAMGQKSLYISIGALGNYYQINGPSNNALYNSGTLTGIIEWLKDKLSAIAGEPQSIPAQDMADIIELMSQSKFTSVSPGGGANNNYVYVKGKDVIDVNHNNFVTFTRKRVFGPIRHKPAHAFVQWFQNVYAKGQLPPDGNEFSVRIINGLSETGFMNKDTGQVLPHKKIDAIKWFRAYIMNITGGECSLAKAKWVSEHLETFLAHVVQHGLPDMSSHGIDNSGLFTNVPPPAFPSNIPTTGGEDLELTDEEHKELAEVIGNFAPTIKFQIKNDQSMTMWVGNNLTTYKFDKVSGTYRAYGEFGGQWEEVMYTGSFQEFKKWVDALCVNLMNILKNSKMDILNGEPTTTPAKNKDKLSLSEVKILKKLFDAHKIHLGTYKKKKLNEDKQTIYSQLIASDPAHSVWFRIHKVNGKYVFSRSVEFGEPYAMVKEFDLFGNLVEYIDFYINGYSSGEAKPEDKAKYNPPILTSEQYEWLEHMLSIKKPGVLLKQFNNGVVGGYDPSHKVPGSDIGNPLFVIRPSHAAGGGIIVQVHTQDNGMEAEEHPFKDFQEMSQWLIVNTDTITQLMPSGGIPQTSEGMLAYMIEKGGFVYQGTKAHPNPNKSWFHYENSKHEKIYLASDGSSQAWLMDPLDGEIYKNDFADASELVTYMQNSEKKKKAISGEPEKSEIDQTKEHLAYLGYASDHPSDDSSIWMRPGEVGHPADYVHLHSDGESKITPAAMTADLSWPSGPFFFHTLQALNAYLTEKHTKGKAFHDVYFASILKKGKFKKKDDEDAEMGYLFHNDSLTVVPFPSGGTMYTNIGVEPKVKLSYESTYDLARRVELYLGGDLDYKGENQEGWSTGDGHLDELIDDAGLIYQGKEDEEDGEVLVFMHKDGYKLRYHTSDHSSSMTLPPPAEHGTKQPTSFAMEGNDELKQYLGKVIAGQKVEPIEKEKMTSTEILNQSILKYPDATPVMNALKWLEKQGLAESVHFQYGNPSAGEIRVLKDNMLLFAVGKKQVGQHELWYVRQKVSDNTNGLYMDYSFTTDAALIDWVKKYAGPLTTWHTVKGDDGLSLGTPSVPKPVGTVAHQPTMQQQSPKTPGPQYYPDEDIVALLKSKGFKGEIMPEGTTWVHPSKFNFTLHTNAIVWHYEQGSKEIYMPHGEQQNAFLKKALQYATKDMNDHELDFAFSQAALSDEDKLFDKAMGMAENVAIPYNGFNFAQTMEDKGFDLDEHTHVWSNEDLYQVVAAVEPEDGTGAVFKVWWIANKGIQSATHLSEPSLFQHIGQNGVLAKQQGAAPVEKYEPPYPPSGEDYKTHDNAANASMIFLNAHDEAILNAMGFVKVPQENQYYKNNLGDIVKFFDDGKAEYVELAGGGSPIDTEQTNSIPHMLKFLVVKYSTGPWSGEDYNTATDLDKIQEIQLNEHDTYMLDQLGFKWDEKQKKYVKFLKSGETPKQHPHHKTDDGEDVSEAKKKKKKKDPNQPELDFNKPEEDDYHEVFTCYDSGNAIWQLMREEGHQSAEIEIYQGPIQKMLEFLWLRWQHGLTKSLIGTKPPKTTPGPVLKGWDAPGLQAPPIIHDKITNAGFVFSKGEYVKKYELPQTPKVGVPEAFWSMIKFNGSYFMYSYPYIGNGKFERKEAESTDPYYILNTIKKIENAEFGPLVQAEEDAIAVKDTTYFNAPTAWLKYNPYAPVVHPGNTKGDPWMEGELKGYGFEWNDNSKMYWYNPVDATPDEKALLWEAVRIDSNGTKVYFYSGGIGTNGERRYFCSTEFNDIQHKIEQVHASSYHGHVHPKQAHTISQQPKGNNGKILDGENYPKAAQADKDFSTQGNAIPLVPQDHNAVLKAGFKFLENAKEYFNKKDKFRLFSNGYVYYKLGGTGEGMGNDIGHFFNMLKEKYGALEWGEEPVTGHELVFYKDKLEKIGFQQVQGLSDNNWTFERIPTDKKTTMNVREKVIIFPNHNLTFYLEDKATTNLLGSYSFENAKSAVNTLENSGPGGIAIALGHELDTVMHQRGFVYNDQTNRYGSTMKVNGLDISITFYGDGIAYAHAWKQLSGENMDMEKEIKFDNFYNAIQWAATKDLDNPLNGADEPQAPSQANPITKEVVDAVMSALGMNFVGKAILGLKYHNTDATKRFMVNLGSGKVIYDFEYMSNPMTGEVNWGQSIFKDWDDFNEFLMGTQKKKPQKGKLEYTPHPSTKEIPVLAVQMPWSGFDYEGWSVGKGYANNSTIGLMPDDEKTMLKLGFQKAENDKGVIYYKNSKLEVIYFYVSGEADHYKDGKAKHYTSIKTLMESLWAESMHSGIHAKGAVHTGPPPTGHVVKPGASNYEHWKNDVDKPLSEMGFKFLTKNIDGDVQYMKKIPGNSYEVIWHQNDDLIEFVWGEIEGGAMKIKEHWTEDLETGLAKLHQGFDAQVKPKQSGVAHKKSKSHKPTKKKLAGTSDMPWSGTDYLQWGNTVLKAVGPNGGMGLHPTEEATLKQLGWTVHSDKEHGVWYESGPQKIVFYPSGYTEYWTDKNGKPTQSWTEIEMPIRWLWKGGKEYMTSSGKPVKMEGDDDDSLKDLGFQLINNNGVLSYRNVSKGASVMFYPNGFGMVWDMSQYDVKKEFGEPNAPIFQGTWQNCIAFLAKNYGPTTAPKKTGEVPYSGTDYKKWWSTYWPDVPPNESISLKPEDSETLKKIGFEKELHKNEKDPAYKVSYRNGHNEVLYFFAGGEAAMWENGEGPHYYGNAKNLMQAMWDKYMPHI
jgi:hypothetical protein